jgi:hypothetical protein
MHPSIDITGLGMASSLAMDVANSCAAARAGVSRPSEITCMNFGLSSIFGRETVDGVPSVVGHVSDLAPGFSGKARLAMLGSAALSDLVRRTALSAKELSDCVFYLSVSDRFIEEAYAAAHRDGAVPARVNHPSDYWRREAVSMADLLLKRSGVEINTPNRSLCFGGHAGFAFAMKLAMSQMEEGRFGRAIVGGVDCCVEPQFLEASASLRMLKTSDSPTGFVPGECAAFVLCENSTSRYGKRKVIARLSSIAGAEEDSHQFSEQPPVGCGLHEAIRESLSSRDDAFPSFVISDLNGGERRAMDWGHALVRVRRNFEIGGLPVWLPAVNFGETGAAAGAVAVCLATRAFERRYSPGPRALICLASDSGHRASLIVEAVAV